MTRKTGARSNYTNEYKLAALQLIESKGINAAAKHLGIPKGSLFNWTRPERQAQILASASKNPKALRAKPVKSNGAARGNGAAHEQASEMLAAQFDDATPAPPAPKPVDTSSESRYRSEAARLREALTEAQAEIKELRKMVAYFAKP